MSEYNFPDREAVPSIEHEPDDPFTSQETKKLFIKYHPEEWNDPEDAVEAIETINYLFGSDVQIVVIDQKIEFMEPNEIRDLLDGVAQDD